MTRKREIIIRIQKQLRDIYGTVASIEQYLGELECIDNYERLNHVSLDNVLSTDPYIKKEDTDEN